ncbi:MAG: sulfotransferase family protein [Candidatus Heimdallarchaeaceae archaeon]
MNKKEKDKDELPEFTFPVSMYYLMKFLNKTKLTTIRLGNFETRCMRKKIRKTNLEKPIYVVGLSRAGTTITVEMLSEHPDVAFHKHIHLMDPFMPQIVHNIAKFLPFIFKKKVERVHRDGLAINRDSPEAVEEMLWMRFFDGLHDEKLSYIKGTETSNPKFEKFYSESIKKLMISQKSTRYVTKNNYNITRMEYLQKLYPNAKFVLIVRNPINHIASYIKQEKIFLDMEVTNKKIRDWITIVGHVEFGSEKVFINLNSKEKVVKIRAMLENQETYVRGYAFYWNSIYSYVNELLKKNKEIAKQTLVVRYEDLTDNSEETIDKIVDHLELDKEKAAEMRAHYIEKLHQPTYYKPSFSDEELDTIKEETYETAKLYGY